jgi:hypothetical protein
LNLSEAFFNYTDDVKGLGRLDEGRLRVSSRKTERYGMEKELGGLVGDG